jgi:hypothetical protein
MKLAAPLAGLAGERGQAGKRGDLPAAELPELGQLSDQRAGNGRPNARHGSEQILLVSPSWRAAHGIVDILIDAGQLLLQRLQKPGDAFAQMGDCHSLLALALSPDHLDDLPSASDEIGKQPGRLVGQRAGLGSSRLGETGDDRSIDRIGLGALSERPGEGSNLRRIDHHNRKSSRRQGRRCDGLKAAGRLQRDNLRRDLPQSCGQTLQSSRIALDYKRFSTRTNSDIETILRHVDPDSDHVHSDPSLPNRASRSAAPATVRVRWNDERGAKLTHGLQT